MLRSVRVNPVASNILATSRTVSVQYALCSEPFGIIRNVSESCGIVPKIAEPLGAFLNRSEDL